jgi:hypothetical protein
MKLLTKALAKQFPAIYATEKTPAGEKMVVAKVFSPEGAATWFLFEADALIEAATEKWMPLTEAVKTKTPYLDVKFFCYVKGLGNDELGYVLLSQLEAIRTPRFRLPMERDLFYTPESLAALRGEKEAA